MTMWAAPSSPAMAASSLSTRDLPLPGLPSRSARPGPAAGEAGARAGRERGDESGAADQRRRRRGARAGRREEAARLGRHDGQVADRIGHRAGQHQAGPRLGRQPLLGAIDRRSIGRRRAAVALAQRSRDRREARRGRPRWPAAAMRRPAPRARACRRGRPRTRPGRCGRAGGPARRRRARSPRRRAPDRRRTRTRASATSSSRVGAGHQRRGRARGGRRRGRPDRLVDRPGAGHVGERAPHGRRIGWAPVRTPWPGRPG